VVEVGLELAPAPIALLYEKSETPELVPSISSLLLSESKIDGNFLRLAATFSNVSAVVG